MSDPANMDDARRRRRQRQRGQGDNGDGDGGDFDSRLRDLEVHMASLDTKVDAIKENMAVKNDVSGVKIWVLIGALTTLVSGIGIAATVAAILIRVLSP